MTKREFLLELYGVETMEELEERADSKVFEGDLDVELNDEDSMDAHWKHVVTCVYKKDEMMEKIVQRAYEIELEQPVMTLGLDDEEQTSQQSQPQNIFELMAIKVRQKIEEAKSNLQIEIDEGDDEEEPSSEE